MKSHPYNIFLYSIFLRFIYSNIYNGHIVHSYIIDNNNVAHDDGSGISMLKFLGIPSSYKRPKMYSFMYANTQEEVNNNNSNQSSVKDNDIVSTLSLSFLKTSLVQVWGKGWSDAGWDPIILTEIDVSKNHPEYEYFIMKLVSSNISKTDWAKYLRYLAMSCSTSTKINNGGYYTSMYVLPINHVFTMHDDGYGYFMPNNGIFTLHDGYLRTYMSGTLKEWNRISNAIIHLDDHINCNSYDCMHTTIHNDLYVFKTLNYNITNEVAQNKIIFEDSFVDVQFILNINKQGNNNDNIKSACNKLRNKKATKLLSGLPSIGYRTHQEYLKALQTSLNKCKPTMYTFFQLAYSKNAEQSLLNEVNNWKYAWESSGYNTIVLTLNDAKKHPLYDKFMEQIKNAKYQTSSYDIMCFARWLAMAVTVSDNGGWMSDYDTYPLQMYYHNTLYNNNYDVTSLPFNGTFTSHKHFVPNLLSGSKSEWNRMVYLIYESYKRHTRRFWSDMLAIRDILQYEKPNNRFMYVFDSIELITVYSLPPPNITFDVTVHGNDYVNYDGAKTKPLELKQFCKITNDQLAIHFSHASCAKSGYCLHDRSNNLIVWLQTWRKLCIIENMMNTVPGKIFIPWNRKKYKFPCISPMMDDNPSTNGLFYIKVPKTSGNMLANINKRIAGREAKRQGLDKSNEKTCKTNDPFKHMQAYELNISKRNKIQSFLWSMIRHPSNRALSHYGVRIKHESSTLQQSTNNDVEFKNMLQKYYISNISTKFLSPFIDPNQIIDNEYTMIVQDILNEYSFIGIYERFYESLVVLSMLLDIDDITDVLFDFDVNNILKCDVLFNNNIINKPEWVTEGMEYYLNSPDWYERERGDYVLYNAVNHSLDLTIEKLGKENVDMKLKDYRKILDIGSNAAKNVLNRNADGCGMPGLHVRQSPFANVKDLFWVQETSNEDRDFIESL